MNSLVQADRLTSRAPARGHLGVRPRRGERISRRPSGDTGTAKGPSKVVLPESTSVRWMHQDPPPEGRTRCLTRHTISPIRWPPAPSTRSIDATTTTQVKGPAILTSSRSSTLADEPSPSATTAAETRASFPSATPTDWLRPTAKKRTVTSTPPSVHGWREPTSLLRSATSSASRPSRCVLPPRGRRTGWPPRATNALTHLGMHCWVSVKPGSRRRWQAVGRAVPIITEVVAGGHSPLGSRPASLNVSTAPRTVTPHTTA